MGIKILTYTPPLFWARLGLYPCLLYTSDAADERSSVDLGGRRIIKKKIKKKKKNSAMQIVNMSNKIQTIADNTGRIALMD